MQNFGTDDRGSRLIWRPSLRYIRATAKPSNKPVWRAIISSSLVGITHAETLLSRVEMRGPALELASSSRSIPSHAEPRMIRLRISTEFSPIPRGEHEAVYSAQHGRHRTDLLY